MRRQPRMSPTEISIERVRGAPCGLGPRRFGQGLATRGRCAVVKGIDVRNGARHFRADVFAGRGRQRENGFAAAARIETKAYALCLEGCDRSGQPIAIGFVATPGGCPHQSVAPQRSVVHGGLRETRQQHDRPGRDVDPAADGLERGAARKLLQVVAEQQEVRRVALDRNAGRERRQQAGRAAFRQPVEMGGVRGVERRLAVQRGLRPICQPVENHEQNLHGPLPRLLL